MSRPPKHHQPGLYPDLPFEAYRAIPAVNSTALRALRHGPRAAWHSRRFETIVTPSMKAGSLAHIQILDPRRWLDAVVCWDQPVLEPLPALVWDKRTPEHYVTACGSYELVKVGGVWQPIAKDGHCPGEHSTVAAAKAATKTHYEQHTARRPKLDADGRPKIAAQNPNSAAYAEFLARNPGREVVTPKGIEQAHAIARAVRDNPEAAKVLTRIWGTEVSVVWLDPDTGVRCKARLDWLSDPGEPHVLLGELKTCRDNAPPWFPRDAARREYHAQLAWYRAGLRALSETCPEIRCVILAVQQGGCHDSTVYALTDEELAAGDGLNAGRLQQMLEYEDTYGDRPWPGKCPSAPLDLHEHAPWVFGGDDSDGIDYGDDND